MKKLIAVLAIISFNAHAAPDCRELPSCESLGFICTAEECGDLKALSCPFDLSKKACFPKEKDCEVGDILYNDLKCYDSGCGKTPIAVVYDTENRMAVQLKNPAFIAWGGFGIDISTEYGCPIDLENCKDVTSAKTTCATDGKANTYAITMCGKALDIDFSAAYCYNSTFGGLPEGSWWMPSIKELDTLIKNKDTIAPKLIKYGVNLVTGYYDSSAECHKDSSWYFIPSGAVTAWYKKDKRDVVCIIGY